MVVNALDVNEVFINCLNCGKRIKKLDDDTDLKTCEFDGDVNVVYFSRIGSRYIIGICPICFDEAIKNERLIPF